MKWQNDKKRRTFHKSSGKKHIMSIEWKKNNNNNNRTNKLFICFEINSIYRQSTAVRFLSNKSSSQKNRQFSDLMWITDIYKKRGNNKMSWCCRQHTHTHIREEIEDLCDPNITIFEIYDRFNIRYSSHECDICRICCDCLAALNTKLPIKCECCSMWSVLVIFFMAAWVCVYTI